MPRCSMRNNRLRPSCTCLVDAFRTFQAEAEPALGCGLPECPVKSLDIVTLKRFLQALGEPDGRRGEDMAGEGEEIPVFRAVARRLKR